MFVCGGHSHFVSTARNCHVLVSVFLHVLLLSLCTLIIQRPHSASCIPVSEFFEFGYNAGDSETAKSDDGGSGQINLTISFPFYGIRHDKLFVSRAVFMAKFRIFDCLYVEFSANLFYGATFFILCSYLNVFF